MANRLPEPFTLNGQPLPDEAQVSLRWSETPISGSTVQRLCTGEAVRQSTWTKRRLSISADGLVPPMLQAVNWAAPVTVTGPRMAALTGFSDGPQVTFDSFAALWSWQLVIEEM